MKSKVSPAGMAETYLRRLLEHAKPGKDVAVAIDTAEVVHDLRFLIRMEDELDKALNRLHRMEFRAEQKFPKLLEARF